MRKYLIVLMCCAILSSCSPNTDTSSDTTSEVSDTITSTEASEPVSSESNSSDSASSDPISSEPVSSSITNTNVATKSSYSTNQKQSDIELKKKRNEDMLESGERINSFINFTVVDLEGKPIKGVETSFVYGYSTDNNVSVGPYSASSTTDKAGKSTIELVKPYDPLETQSLMIDWDRPFYATITSPDGKQTKESSRRGSAYLSTYTRIKANETYNFKIVLEETTLPPELANLTEEELEQYEMEQQRVEAEKRNGEKIKSYMNFVVTDPEGNPIEGIKTSFQSGVPDTSGPHHYVDFDESAMTDKSGKTSVELIRQFDYLGISSISLMWDRPYHATVNTPDGKQTIEPSKEGNVNIPYYINVNENEYYTFKVVLDEYKS